MEAACELAEKEAHFIPMRENRALMPLLPMVKLRVAFRTADSEFKSCHGGSAVLN